VAKPFPTDNPFLKGYFAPVNTEADAGHLQITGEMPKELCGTLYRNGPNPQFAPRGPYHWFGGDGMIHAFHVENGNVSYKNRWVRTPKWMIENAEGEGLSGTFGNPRYTDPRVFALNSTIANTNIVWHGGKLLALEEAHAPFSLDPKSLMPVGPKDGGYETFGDKLIGPFTAHPKFDPETGEMVFFGYSATGRFTKEVSIQTVTEDGTVTRAEMLEGPYPSMIHDFAVTKNWIVVPIFPLTSSMERAMGGLPPFAWEPDKGTHIAFIPRKGTVADVKWVTAPPSYVFHPMNHFETDDGRIVIDVMKYDVAPLFPLPDGSPSTKEPPVPLDLRPVGPVQHLPRGAAGRPRRRISALRRTVLHERLPPRLDRVGQRHPCRRAPRRGHHPLRPEEGHQRHLESGRGRPVRRAGVRAPSRQGGGRRRLGAGDDLPRRRGPQRPRRFRGDRHRQGAGGACPSQQPGAGGLPWQLASRYAVG
jgi:hypothetical protein